MAIFYKLSYVNNKKNPQFSGFYAKIANKGMVTTDMVADEIQRNCSMKRSDVLAVLAELSEVLKQQIQQSHSVKLDGIGVFRPGIKSRMVHDAGQFKTASHIKGLRLNFLGESFKQGRQRVKAVFAGARVQQEGAVAQKQPAPETKDPDTGQHVVPGGGL